MAKIDDVLAKCDKCDRPNYQAIASEFGVERSTLSKRHCNKTGSKEAQYESQSKLTKEQDAYLVSYINRLSDQELPPTNMMVRNFIEELSNSTVGKNFVGDWCRKHQDDLLNGYLAPFDIKRKKADCYQSYSRYFTILKQKMEEYSIQPYNMYNIDEKGFLIGISTKLRRIFSRHSYENGFLKGASQDGNRDWITCLGCICADRTALPPALIYLADSSDLQESWLQDFSPFSEAAFFLQYLLDGPMTMWVFSGLLRYLIVIQSQKQEGNGDC
jgi:hypothetical protein